MVVPYGDMIVMIIIIVSTPTHFPRNQQLFKSTDDSLQTRLFRRCSILLNQLLDRGQRAHRNATAITPSHTGVSLAILPKNKSSVLAQAVAE